MQPGSGGAELVEAITRTTLLTKEGRVAPLQSRPLPSLTSMRQRQRQRVILIRHSALDEWRILKSDSQVAQDALGNFSTSFSQTEIVHPGHNTHKFTVLPKRVPWAHFKENNLETHKSLRRTAGGYEFSSQ